MIGPIEKVPDKYQDEYRVTQTGFIKGRVHFFCLFSVTIYFVALFIWFLLYPKEVTYLELLGGMFLVISGAVILLLNSRASGLKKTKFNAYLFAVLLLALVGKFSIEYDDSPMVISSIIMFTLFLVATTIPWTPVEVAGIGILHLIAYSVSFSYVRIMTHVAPKLFNMEAYFDGMIFILMGVILCVVMRRKETRRDITNFVLLKEVEEKSDEMGKELEMATRVHKTIIPGPISTDKVEIAVDYLPVSYIGGDYAKYEFMPADRLMFILTDVTGHGVSAALLVNRIHAEFERLAKEDTPPGELLKSLNSFITEDFADVDMYLSAFCGRIDFRKMKLEYSNYGHPSQYLCAGNDGSVRDMPAQTGLLGLPMEDPGTYQNEMDIGTGDRILLFTDGILETTGANALEYGGERIKAFLKKNRALHPGEFNHRILEDLDAFKEGPFKDDICLMTLEVKAHKGMFHWPA
jgi:hypothetical protein